MTYFRCHTVHVVELLNYYTNYCTYIKFIKFYICAVVGIIIELQYDLKSFYNNVCCFIYSLTKYYYRRSAVNTRLFPFTLKLTSCKLYPVVGNKMCFVSHKCVGYINSSIFL